ncbi:MAG TPA: hypothetical protein VN691_12675 [Steroidobacteraceae bacterium]|nr:hypothetical protein [Steroidobacteraceae bacterium]
MQCYCGGGADGIGDCGVLGDWGEPGGGGDFAFFRAADIGTACADRAV